MESNSEHEVTRWVTERLSGLHPPVGWQPDVARGLERLRAAQAAESKRRKAWLWVGLGATVICAGALAFPATGVFAQRCLNACIAGAGRAAIYLHRGQPTSGVIAERARVAAPDFTLPDLSGAQVSLSSLRGRPALVTFWATWCAPCNAEIPSLIGLQKTFGGAGLAVVGIAMDDDGWNSVKPFVERQGLNYRVVLGNEELAEQYGGVDALPTAFLIDAQGRIAATYQGLIAASAYQRDIQSLLSEAGR